MSTDLIPIIDLRYLSQSDLTSLSLSSPNTFNLSRCDDIVNPKIDRSIFNESAGSRKQTYSRLPLAPPLSSSLPRRRGRPRSIPPPSSPDDSSADPDRCENLLIASFLRHLFSRPRHNNDGWTNILDAAEQAHKALVLADADDGDRDVLDSKGVAVDLVAVGKMDDPFGEELRRRTEGLRSDEELLAFLSGVDGQWGSRRKRRRFVEASLFGDVLPRSWKLLLGIKRKDGSSWLDCRRYVRFAVI